MNSKITNGAAAALAVLALSACAADYGDVRTAGYVPQLPEQVYPIEVASGSVELRLPVQTGRLTLRERQALRRLARSVVSLETPLLVLRPAGSVKAEVLAAEATRELLANGIPARRIVHRTARLSGEVVVRYRRKFAVTRECGDWSRPVNETGANRPYRDFGCSQQHNIAAQVDNPQDFQRPRTMTPPDGDTRNEAIKRYRQRGEYTSTWPGGVKVNINEGMRSLF